MVVYDSEVVLTSIILMGPWKMGAIGNCMESFIVDARLRCDVNVIESKY
jgi:hypothetical protein